MPEIVIRAEGLGKKYTIGRQANGHRTLRDVLADSLAAPFRAFHRTGSDLKQISNLQDLTSHGTEEFWALEDISFDVNQGDVVGIIGRNGAGKSTLLKILSRITEPTKGRVRIRGRVASLLEVGTGFHPELTGRENVFLNGAILGMSREEIKCKFDEIVAFAEVEKFLDTPVKRYSSGMYVRLAFAVAAHLDPEILIVDEVLAVGDAQFQKKCLGRMKQVGKEGRTVLFVSHSMAAITQLCSTALLVERGSIAQRGAAKEVVGHYLSTNTRNGSLWQPIKSSHEFTYHSVSLNCNGLSTDNSSVPADSSFEITFDYSVNQMLPPGRLAFLITNQEGTTVLSSANTDANKELNKRWTSGRKVLRCEIPGHLLSPGRYYLTVSEPTEQGLDILHENILSFAISELNSLGARDGRSGVIMPLLNWREDQL